MTLLLAFLLLAQSYTHRGYVESRAAAYPQDADNDPANLVVEARMRYEGFYRPFADLDVAGGIDVRIDSHKRADRDWSFSWLDRGERRPPVSVSRLSALYSRAGFTVEAGKQFVRWGKADIVTPTDRFAPRDFLEVVNHEFLPVTAVRATYERGADSLDVVWTPLFTPSRLPLPDQRWAPAAGAPPAERIPANRPQYGVRWNRSGSIDYALSYYRGVQHTPSFLLAFGDSTISVRQVYSAIQMFGVDSAIPVRWLVLKTEVAHFHALDARSDSYFQYVLQLERQSGEWSFVGGYAGEIVTERGTQAGSFDPDRGLTETLLGRASYTIDANRSIALEAAVRQNLDGVWTKFEYSHAFGQHWRVTAGVALIGGRETDFLGRYDRNSHGIGAIRYSF